MDNSFWKGKKVLVTGVTGFKGCWLAKMLDYFGANVLGIALEPDYGSVYSYLKFSENYKFKKLDIRNYSELKNEVSKFEPEIIFHLAAQAIVKTAKENPLETFETNVMGTANLLDILKESTKVKSIVIVTSDKVYENIETEYAYSEISKLSGNEPYSCSKVCEEMVAKAYRESYFAEKNIGLATARAANVFGGGDNHFDRLIPYLMKTVSEGKIPTLRNPNAIRPWQYILDVLDGYLTLAIRLYNEPSKYSESWNFGPFDKKTYTVGEITNLILKADNREILFTLDSSKNTFNESKMLMIDSQKSFKHLGWKTKYTIDDGIKRTLEMYKKFFAGKDLNDLILAEIIQNESRD